MIKKIMITVCCGLIFVGCLGRTEKKKIDPANFEEISPRLYWNYKSNLQGKAISEAVSADGTFVYGRYIAQRTTNVGTGMSMQEWTKAYASTSFPFRANYAELDIKGAFIEPFTARILEVDVATRILAVNGSMNAPLISSSA